MAAAGFLGWITAERFEGMMLMMHSPVDKLKHGFSRTVSMSGAPSRQ
jgi:hypothetical protein